MTHHGTHQSENTNNRERERERESEKIKRDLRVVNLYSRDVHGRNHDDDGGSAGREWGCISLEHPSTFETLAMDPSLYTHNSVRTFEKKQKF